MLSHFYSWKTACLIFCLIAAAVPARAGENALIAEIRVEGCTRMTAAQILANLKLRKGGRFSRVVLDGDIRRLLELGYLVSVDQDTLPDHGVVLTLIMKERPVVRGVYFSGNTLISINELEENVHLAEDDILHPYLLDLDKRNIEDHYKTKGCMFVQTSHQIEEVPGGVVVRYLIREGPRMIIEEIIFNGNLSLGKKELLNVMMTQENMAVLRPGYFNEDMLRSDIMRLEAYYRTKGWLDAEVFLSDTVFSGDGRTATVRIQVVERERYRVKDVRISGNVIFSSETLLEDLKLKPGMFDDEILLGADFRRLAEKYGENGYHLIRGRHLKIKRLFSESDRSVSIHYIVQEQGKSYIGKIRFKGNTKTKDVVIQRELSFVPGEEFNLREINQSIKRLSRLGIFASVNIARISEGASPDVRDVQIIVEEAQTGNLRFDVGFSSIDNIVGGIELTMRNFDYKKLPTSFGEVLGGTAFTGDGQTLRMSARGGFVVQNYSIDFYEPYLFDRDYSFGWGAYIHKRAYTDYDEGRTGYDVVLGRKILPDLKSRLTWRSELIDIDHVESDAISDLQEEEGRSLVNSLKLSFVYDVRDNPYFPSTGHRIEGSYQVAGSVFGSEWNYWRTKFSTDWHSTLYSYEDRSSYPYKQMKHTLSLGGNAGLAGAYGRDDEVPFFERFFAGGTNKLRGFSYRSLGPQEGDDPTGGEFSVVGHAEYSVPLLQTVFRGVLFYDMGNVFETMGSFEMNELRASTGFELRIVIPQLGPVPIRVGYAVPVIAKSGDEVEHFYFDLGSFTF